MRSLSVGEGNAHILCFVLFLLESKIRKEKKKLFVFLCVIMPFNYLGWVYISEIMAKRGSQNWDDVKLILWLIMMYTKHMSV